MKPSVNIHIGDYYASRTPVIISTILGPCAAVCLHDPERKIGGMNHILLPGNTTASKNSGGDSRYGVHAMELLINQMMKLGAERKKLTAKVFGGATILPTVSSIFNTGMKNIEFVVDFLLCEKIPITNYNFGGADSRRIYYHTDTNDVLMRKIKTREIVQEYSNISQRLQDVESKIRNSSRIIFFD